MKYVPCDGKFDGNKQRRGKVEVAANTRGDPARPRITKT